MIEEKIFLNDNLIRSIKRFFQQKKNVKLTKREIDKLKQAVNKEIIRQKPGSPLRREYDELLTLIEKQSDSIDNNDKNLENEENSDKTKLSNKGDKMETELNFSRIVLDGQPYTVPQPVADAYSNFLPKLEKETEKEEKKADNKEEKSPEKDKDDKCQLNKKEKKVDNFDKNKPYYVSFNNSSGGYESFTFKTEKEAKDFENIIKAQLASRVRTGKYDTKEVKLGPAATAGKEKIPPENKKTLFPWQKKKDAIKDALINNKKDAIKDTLISDRGSNEQTTMAYEVIQKIKNKKLSSFNDYYYAIKETARDLRLKYKTKTTGLSFKNYEELAKLIMKNRNPSISNIKYALSGVRD